MLNKFNDNMDNNMNNFNKEYAREESKYSARLDKLSNNIKKINNYIEETNEKINIKDLKDIDNMYYYGHIKRAKLNTMVNFG